MSEENNKLDEFLRSKLEPQRFEMKEAYWENARKLIDAERRKKKGAGRAWLLLLLIPFGAIAIWGYIHVSSSTGNADANNATVAMNVQATTDAEPSPVQSQAAASAQHSSPATSSGQIAGNNEPGQAQQASDAPGSEPMISTQHTATATAATSAAHTNSVAANDNMRADDRSAQAGNASHATNSGGNNIAHNTHPFLADAHGDNATHRAASASFAKASRTALTPVSGFHAAGANKVALQTNEPTIIASDVYNNESEASLYIPSESSRIASLMAAGSAPLSNNKKNSDNSNNKLVQSPAALPSEARIPVAHRPFRFTAIEAGINSYAGNSFDNSLNFHAGMRHYRYIGARMAISLGLGYARINQNSLTRSYHNVAYSFGSTSSDLSIATHRLDYIELPLVLHYAIHGNHYIGIGATAAYLVQSAEVLRESGEHNTVKNDNGHIHAFNSFDLQAGIGYWLILPNRFNASAGYYFGLTDLSRNDIFHSNTFNRNTGFRLTVGYKLF